MFNYASNGYYWDTTTSNQSVSPNEDYITTGLYSMEDEDGTSYYFRGAVENNNVQFGEYESDYYVYQGNNNTNRYYQSESSCQEAGNNTCTAVKLASAGDKMYWKIVRINGDGSIRLIYNGTSASPIGIDLISSYMIGRVSYNLSLDDPKYAGYTYDNGTDSFIKREVDTWYSNTLGSSSYDAYVTTGRFCSDSSGYQAETDYGFPDMGDMKMFASYDRLGQSANNYAKANSPTLICPETSESYGGSYRLKAGLITADELVLAGESYAVAGNSYLNIGTNGSGYSSMTPAGGSDSDDFIGMWEMRVSPPTGIVTIGDVGIHGAVRPVINVTTNNGFASGSGSVSDPYVIAG